MKGRLCEQVLTTVGRLQMNEFLRKLCSTVENDVNFAVEVQQKLMLSSSTAYDVVETNNVLEMCVVDTSQKVHDCSKAVLSLDSVLTTVVMATTSVLISGSCISSTVALMYM